MVDRAGEGRSYGNLRNVYQSLGNYSKAIKYHVQHLSIAKEVVDPGAEGTKNGNLGNTYQLKGAFLKVIKNHLQDLVIERDDVVYWYLIQ